MVVASLDAKGPHKKGPHDQRWKNGYISSNKSCDLKIPSCTSITPHITGWRF